MEPILSGPDRYLAYLGAILQNMDAKDQLLLEATERGFLAAWSGLDLPDPVQVRYRDWVAGGNHAEMGYLAPPERIRPKDRFAWASSVLVLAAQHAYPQPSKPAGGTRLGKVAKYAWVRDYHKLISPHLRALEALAQSLGVQAQGYVDTGPLSERSYGVLGGLGWIGRNTMLMRMAEGSYMTLAVLLTALPSAPVLPYPVRCGTCTRCIAACPTQALDGAKLDARRCISYWTIEHRGVIPHDMWEGIGDWVFGCDICQAVCPWNRKAQDFWAGFMPEAGLAHLDLEDCFISSKSFERKYAHTVFLRPGRTRMARNALIVLANLAHLPLVLKGAEDINPVVRATAAAALAKLGQADRAHKLTSDPDPLVVAQAKAALDYWA
jgi:epoxyqueuosine reductase